MKPIFIQLFLLLCLCSCDKTFTDAVTHERHTRVQLTIASGDTMQISRATDESAIEDVNLYLFGETGQNSLHLYSTSPALNFEIEPGSYDLFVVANRHSDLGMLSAAQLSELSFPYQEAWDDIPMAAACRIVVPATDGVYMPPAIEVKRQLAKIVCGISVSATAPTIKLQSVCLCNIPYEGYFFDDAEPAVSDEAYRTGCHTEVAEGRISLLTAFYIPANCQGTVASITTQQQKSEANAPRHATYLLIHATKGTKVLTYRVYLGENNTTDFNVRKNSSHTLTISIRGDKEVDTRISSYTVNVRDDLAEAGYGGYCIDNGAAKHLFVQVESTGTPPALTCTVDVIFGDGEALSIGGKPAGAVFTIDDISGMNDYRLTYAPARFDSTNSTLEYTVTVRDGYGFCQTFDFTHMFANMLSVRIKGDGTVAAASALYTADDTGIPNELHVLGNRFTLRAKPGASAVFDGWYSDEACTVKVSAATSYSHVATARTQTLYAKFTLADHTPLDAAGTANCYIAPKLLARYSFDATVMGKGDWSTNIRPKRLSGTTAKVIWETGRHDEYESVIRYALYENGCICFSTGSKRGNALIGLFDKDDRCIWSWHIWAVDYDPESASETYSSGYTFMSRNLGVLSTSMTERGLYYQWGRKDPFIYPSSPTAVEAPAETYNLPGYEFCVRGNIGGALFPAEDYTVEWATAHPTTLLVRPFKGTVYLDSWLYTPNPNLWGNATSGSIASIKSKKSIYDPCPPGWRVPDRAAWGVATFRDSNFPMTYGASMYYGSNSNLRTFYPYTGYLSGESSEWQYLSLDSDAYVWTNEPHLTSTNDAGYCVRIANGLVNLSMSLGQQFGCPVRCVRE